MARFNSLLSLSFFSLFLLALLFTSCAGVKPSQTNKGVPSTPEKSTEDSLLLSKRGKNLDIAHESFLRGLVLRNTGETDYAELFYKRALAHDPENGFLAFELAEILASTGKSSEALSIASKAIRHKTQPNSSDYYLLARLFRENGLIDSSRVYYKKSIEANEQNMRALYEYSLLLEILQDYRELSRVYTLLLPVMHYPRPIIDKQKLLLRLNQDDSGLVHLLQQSYEIHADPTLGHELSESLIDQGRHSEALEILQQLSQADTNDHKALQQLARLNLRMGNPEAALEELRTLYRRDGTRHDILQRMGMIEYDLNHFDSATVHFRILIDKEPDDHLAYFYLSNLWQMRGLHSQALEAIKEAIRLKPDALAYQNQLAHLYTLSGDYQAAHLVLDQAQQKHPEQPLGMQFKATALIHEAVSVEAKHPQPNSAEALRAIDLRQQATVWLQKAVAIDSLSSDLLFDLASNFERLKNFTDARIWFEKLIAKYPKHHAALNYLGYMLIDAGMELDKGLAMVDTALQLDPGNLAYLDSKAWGLHKKGKHKEALEIFLQIESKGMDDVSLWEHLALVYTALGESTKAAIYWDRVRLIAPNHPSLPKP